MRTKNVLKNVKINMMILLLTVIAQFLNRTFLIKLMGNEINGLIQLFSQLIGYLNIVELGLGGAATYIMYKPLAEKDYNQLSKYLYTVRYFYRIIFIIVIILGVVISVILPFIFSSEISKYEIIISWLMFVFSSAITYLYGEELILFNVDQKNYVVKGIELIGKFLVPLIQLVSIFLVKSIIIFSMIIFMGNIMQLYLYKKYSRKNYNQIKIKKTTLNRGIIKNIKLTFLNKLSILIITSTDYIVLGKFTSLKDVSIYSSYYMILQTIILLKNLLYTSIRGSVGNYFSQNNEEKSYTLNKEITIIFSFTGFILSYSMYKLIISFVVLWLGEPYILKQASVLFLSLNCFILFYRASFDTFKEAKGAFSDIYNPIIEGVLNLVVSIILVQKIGILGVILGTTVSSIIITVFSRPIYVYRKCFLKKGKRYLCDFIPMFLLLIINTLILEKIFLFKLFLRESGSLGEWVKQAFLTLTIVFLTTLVVFLFEKNFRKIIKRYFYRRKS